jgi:hypothetical protein
LDPLSATKSCGAVTKLLMTVPEETGFEGPARRRLPAVAHLLSGAAASRLLQL